MKCMRFVQVTGPRVAVARQKALNYLEIQVDQLKYTADPYQIALVAYALLLTKSPKADTAFIILSGSKQQSGKKTIYQP